MQAIHGRVDPLADVDFSPPRFAEVDLVFQNDENLPENSPTTNNIDTNVTSSSSDDDDHQQRQPQQQQQQHQSSATVKPMKIDLNKSVKDFKSQLRYVSIALSPLLLLWIYHNQRESDTNIYQN